MKILVACEESQAVTIELRKFGHEAYSCDIEPCSGGHPEWHLQVDALELLKIRWDMIIAFPPCTYLSNAGACRLYPKKGQLNQERYEKGLEAKSFFLRFLNADCPKIAVENPVSSTVFQMPPHSQEIQPWQFGHPYTKKQGYGYEVCHCLSLQTLYNQLDHMCQPELEEETGVSMEPQSVVKMQKTGQKHFLVSQKRWQSSGPEK